MDWSHLAGVNATLNFTSAVFLGAGYWAIRNKRIAVHRACMITAFAVSVLFLICYVIYHVQVGSVRYTGQGWLRPVYFSILISHVTLAFTVPVLATVTLVRGLRANYERHRAVARWAWPIWMYVSVTGVIVYLMLYGIGR
jgi:uncharacterized membrane protein YozB (DUF420 family)